MIHEDLASYNEIETGDQIVLVNPDQEEDTYTLTVSGIYEKEGGKDSASAMMGGFMPGADAANQIYMKCSDMYKDCVVWGFQKKPLRSLIIIFLHSMPSG